MRFYLKNDYFSSENHILLPVQTLQTQFIRFCSRPAVWPTPASSVYILRPTKISLHHKGLLEKQGASEAPANWACVQLVD